MRVNATILFLTVTLLGVGIGTYVWEKRFSGDASQITLYCAGCNVILISLDTLGAKHLGLYGYGQSTSPFLDMMARESGIVFENAISQAPWTLPSHAAMLTARDPEELNIWSVTDVLPPEVKTIAEVLRENGFATRAFSYGAFVQPAWGFDQGFEDFSGSSLYEDWEDIPRIFNEAAGSLRDSPKEPFFLFIRSFYVHDPYAPVSRAGSRVHENGEPVEVDIEDIVEANTRQEGFTTRELERFRDAYDAQIKELDAAIKEFFQELETNGVLDNTIVIITADHGEEFGEHGTVGFHVGLYDETIHVPLIMVVPGKKPMRIERAVEVRALPPTILDLVGLPAEPEFKTESLFSGEGEQDIALSVTGMKRDRVFQALEKGYGWLGQIEKSALLEPRKGTWDDFIARSARSERWHLISDTEKKRELYDLSVDPGEKKDLYASWANLSPADQRETLRLFSALAIEAPCGEHCQYEE